MITIKYCQIFEFECPQKWENFGKSEKPGKNVRFCKFCERDVYLCETDAEYETHKNAENCVAVDIKPPGEKRLKRLAGMPPRNFPK